MSLFSAGLLAASNAWLFSELKLHNATLYYNIYNVLEVLARSN